MDKDIHHISCRAPIDALVIANAIEVEIDFKSKLIPNTLSASK